MELASEGILLPLLLVPPPANDDRVVAAAEDGRLVGVRSVESRTNTRIGTPASSPGAGSVPIGLTGSGGGKCFSSRTGVVSVHVGLGRPTALIARTR